MEAPQEKQALADSSLSVFVARLRRAARRLCVEGRQDGQGGPLGSLHLQGDIMCNTEDVVVLPPNTVALLVTCFGGSKMRAWYGFALEAGSFGLVSL